jgi:hypothetical protein
VYAFSLSLPPNRTHLFFPSTVPPSDPTYGSRKYRWGLKSDIEYYKKVLDELQEEDDAEAETNVKKKPVASKSRSKGDENPAPEAEGRDDEDNEPEDEDTPETVEIDEQTRVGAFIAARKKCLKPVEQVRFFF